MSVDFSDPGAVARAAARTMWDRDLASRSLGMSLDAVSEGEATLSLTITAAMTNGHQVCHGGYIFSVADSAFAFACNSYNQNTIAQHCSVTFLRPAFAGDRLTAAAREISRTGRSGNLRHQGDEPERRARCGVPRPLPHRQGDAYRRAGVTDPADQEAEEPYGRPFARPGDLDPIEIASRDEISALQLTRLKTTLAHAYRNSPHYRVQFDKAGAHPDDLKTLSDLSRFPSR